MTKLNAATWVSLGLAPAAPKNVKITRTRLEPTKERRFRQGYQVRFTWEHDISEPGLKGFKIAIAETTDATYQRFIALQRRKSIP